MTSSHLTGVVLSVLLAASASAQTPIPVPRVDPAATPYLLFFQSQAVGRDEVSVIRTAEGWTIRGASRQGPPMDVTTRIAEVLYDADWRPKSLLIDGVVRGQDITLKTTFAGGKASNIIAVQGEPQTKVDVASPDAVVLPNSFLGSYAALARKLQGKTAGAQLRAYVAPQGEVPITLMAVTSERIDTPKAKIAATRYALVVNNPPPGGDVPLSIWTDAASDLLRMSVPSQGLELAREDIASTAARTVSFSLPGDESVQIPASGFNLAATITRPPNAVGRLPALVLIAGSGPLDRDETVAGIPVFGHMTRDLVAAGFLVVRYDKRGVGQSGGRTEAVTLGDYADDVRSIVMWLDKRKDVDPKRIGLIGHSEGAGIAMLAAAREDKRVRAVALLAGISSTGAAVVLEQQRRLLDRSKADEPTRQSKIALQQKIHAAVLTGTGWDGVPAELRRTADTPWFHSYLSFDAATAMKGVKQPILILQGERDTQVLPYHADKLAELARARKGKADVQEVKVPDVNHLFVVAKTGEVEEYATLGPGAQVSDAVTSATATWMMKTLGAGK